VEVAVDPGDHVVTGTAPGISAVQQRLHVDEGGGPRRIEIVLATRPAGESGKGPAWPGAAVLGVGITALAAGAAGGAYALVLAGQVKDHCVGDQCRASDQGKADDSDTLARASTWLMVGGAACAAAGVVLLVVRPGGKGAAQRWGSTRAADALVRGLRF
jgi:hypothetical protein